MYVHITVYIIYVGGNGVEVSWAGGIDGREVIDKFLPLIHV